MSYHLAQANVARLVAPLDDPRIEGFVSRLTCINALAEKSPGFIWRLKDEAGNDSTSIQAFPDPMVLVNMSVWESVEALKEFTYKSGHSEPLRMRRDWFEKYSGPSVAMWWVPVGHTPTVQEARERLELLEANGPTARAFTFARPFLPPDA